MNLKELAGELTSRGFQVLDVAESDLPDLEDGCINLANSFHVSVGPEQEYYSLVHSSNGKLLFYPTFTSVKDLIDLVETIRSRGLLS